MTLAPDTPVKFIKGVGEGRAAALAAYDIRTVRDLLWFFPFRYEDRRHPLRIADIGRHLDTPVLLRGKVISARAHVSPRKRMKIFEAAIEDGTGAVKLIWFNQPFLADQIDRGDRLSVYGVPRGTYGHVQIESPDWEKFEGAEDEAGAIVPIYSKITNVPPKALRKIIGAALDQGLESVDDPMPDAMRAATIRGKVGAMAAAIVERPMMSGPTTRNGFRPMRSEYGPAISATAIPGAP